MLQVDDLLAAPAEAREHLRGALGRRLGADQLAAAAGEVIVLNVDDDERPWHAPRTLPAERPAEPRLQARIRLGVVLLELPPRLVRHAAVGHAVPRVE